MLTAQSRAGLEATAGVMGDQAFPVSGALARRNARDFRRGAGR